MLLASLTAGVVIAFALTWFMHALIQSTEGQLNESARVHLLDFVRVKRQESAQRKERSLERPQSRQAPSAPLAPESRMTSSQESALGLSALPMGEVSEGDTASPGDIGFGQQEGEYLPLVKVQPVYPLRAMRRGLEGTCMVRYTVTATGVTRDVQLVPGQCADEVFQDVSIEAARKFKYKPRVINGEAIEVPGVRNRFIFEMSDQ